MVPIVKKIGQNSSLSLARLSRGRKKSLPFNPHGNDTMVYMHIQKTGGSQFLEHLVTVQKRGAKNKKKGFVNSPSHQIQLCENRTDGWTRRGGYIGHGKKIFIQYVSCPRNPLDKEGETWLVSEKTTSWMCGVHAFYTDFKRCLSHLDRYNSKTERKFPVVSENKRFHYVVILRHPIHRFLSEYLHTLRGACWLHNHYCNGEKTYWPLASNLSKPCFELLHCSQAHINITLEEFADCKDAWSTNRQTVVLADIDEASCWSKSSYTQKERNKLLLDSAKHNLRKLSYFGLTEFQEESGDLFERTFGLNFLNPPKKIEFNDTHAGKVVHSVVQDSELYKRVVQRNCLDLELYKFALGLFEQRLNAIGKPLNRTTLDYIRTTLPDDSFCTGF